MGTYYVIRERGANFHRAMTFVESFPMSDWVVPAHYYDAAADDIVFETDAFVKFSCNDVALAESLVTQYDKQI